MKIKIYILRQGKQVAESNISSALSGKTILIFAASYQLRLFEKIRWFPTPATTTTLTAADFNGR